MKTFMANPENVQENWIHVDATGIPMGRLASQLAAILRGKNLPTFTPHALPRNFIVVTNVEKMVLTGNKLEDKFYIYHTGYVGGRKEVQYKKIMAEKPDFALKHAVKGMLPKTIIGRTMLTRIKIFAGDKHPHEAQKPETITVKGGRN